MRPGDNPAPRSSSPLIPERSHLDASQSRSARTADAAASVVRGQLDEIYQKQDERHTSVEASQENAAQNEWQKYHSAWQEYYQQYYERYYIGQVHQVRQELEAKVTAEQHNKKSEVGVFTQPIASGETSSSKKEAIEEIRSQLKSKVNESAKKVRGSRHFIPITAAVCVMGVFLFLQYNRVLFSNVQAYITPGTIDPQNIVVDPSQTQNVGPDAKLIIPKINVDVPVIYGVGNDHDSQMAAMEKGVAHFSIPGASSVPGQVGNTVLSGHSSNDILDSGDYKFIFAQLEKLQVGDTIYTNYEGKRYSYSITKKEVVTPTEVNKLIYPTDKPILTLITCTPLGTSTNRLLVTAEQVSPDPSGASAAPAASSSGESVAIPGNSPTLLERLFGN